MFHFTRRLFIAAPAAFAAFPVFAEEVQHLSVEEAHTLAAAGDIVLIDIRRPDEWARTGIAGGAVPIDMRVRDLSAQIDAALGRDRDAPVALICHSGVRSAALSAAMARAGFGNVYDVGEGMAGSDHGPGWLARSLPITQPE